MSIEEAVVLKLKTLDEERQRQVLVFVESLLAASKPVGTARRSPGGLWAGLKADLSEEEIQKARHETWGSFPRDDIR
jgi:hypothetical protein